MASPVTSRPTDSRLAWAPCSMSHPIGCSEIWGGNRGDQLNVRTRGLRASLFSRACDGGRGGDLYYVSVCDSDQLTRLAIADVMGHGAAVAETSNWLYRSMKRHMNALEGDAVLAELNAASVKKGYEALTTMAVAGYYQLNRTLYFAYAGHPELLLTRRGTSAWFSAESHADPPLTAVPLGDAPDARYLQRCLGLDVGDKFFLYTDGVLEARRSDGEEFGKERLLATLRHVSDRDPEDVRDRVVDALRAHTDNRMTHDDVTFIVAEVLD